MGDIFDIYIARKRNKEGKRFGFVTMLDVKDPSELAKNVSKIRLGDYRLKCNVARFVLEEGEIRQQASSGDKQFPKSQGGAGDGPFIRKENGYNFMSYKEAFTRVSKGKVVEVDSNTNAFEGLHGKTIVVRVTSLYVLQRIKGVLKEMKLHEGVVRVLGGLQVLIEFNSKVHAEMALNEFIGRPDLFSKPEIWEGQPTHFERIAWLKVFGIRLCMLENKVVNDVGSLFGEVVKSARVERVGLDASFQFIGVLIKHGNRIQDEVFLRWKGRTFKIWVLEDYNEWLEDFVLDPREEENGGSGQRNEEGGMDAKSPEK
ncbi:putative RNA-binding domain superfamily [Helianthus annuus]|nr:putative RNA-binding domain superfamily [Helianthus annuus]